jgi:RNA polymerase sigma-70 factor, ECF subfamily
MKNGGGVLTDSATTIEELVSCYQVTQDTHCFNQIHKQCKPRAYAICLRMTRSIPDAEDLSQDALLQLWRRIDTFRGESKFMTWFQRLTINVVLMHLRKKGLRVISLDELAESDGPGESPRSFGKDDPELVAVADRLSIEQAISDLPAGYRLIFVLHDIEGYQHNEIASMLDCSIGNSKSQLHKARLKLRGDLRELPGSRVLRVSRGHCAQQ